MKFYKVTCLKCGMEFSTRRYGLGFPKFCSAECRNSPNLQDSLREALRNKLACDKTETEMRKCRRCGDSFSVLKYMNNVFCSQNCGRKFYNRVRGRAKLSFHYNRGPCQICKFEHSQSCHIIEAKNGGPLKEWNVLHLCPNHHWKFDNVGLDMEELNALGVGFLAA